MSFGVKLFITLLTFVSLAYVVKKAIESVPGNPEGFQAENITEEVSYPEYLTVHSQGNGQGFMLESETKNVGFPERLPEYGKAHGEVRKEDNETISDHRIEGGPSITESLDFVVNDYPDGRDNVEGVTSDYGDSTDGLPPDREKRDVDVVCINPTQTRVDECIEGMNRQVAEKCLPGINKVFNYMKSANDGERPKGAYSIQSNHSEVCMRDVFSGCSYDSRYRIKTKIKKLIGVNLDLAFQDEFEMDECDEQLMDDVIEDAKDCFKEMRRERGDIPKLEEVKTKQNISSEILYVIGQCVEDHTAFSCILENTDLFKKTMRKLVRLLREESLSVLEDLGADEYKYTRLCLKWIDFDRLENCQPAFFDYVICLKNGTTKPKLFSEVRQCFQNSLKVCPKETVKLFIEILAGAVEGRSGKEPEYFDQVHDKEFQIYSPPSSNKCSPEIIRGWSQDLERCIKPSLPTVFVSENVLQSLAGVTITCIEKTNPQECRYHKASEFMVLLEELHGVLNKIPAKAPSHTSFEQPVLPLPPNCKVVCTGDGGRRKPPKRLPGAKRRPHIGQIPETFPDSPQAWPEEPDKHFPGQPDEHFPGQPDEHFPGQPDEYFPGQPDEYFPGQPDESFPGPDDSDYSIEQSDGPGRPKVNWKNCLAQAANPKMKKCFVLLFYYYVSVHHSHHSMQSRQKLLDKAKLCFQVTLQGCPFDFIQRLFQIFGVILNHDFPKISKSSIITQVTIPEGYIWCETRIYTKEYPIPTFKEFTFPAEGFYTQRVTPTTVVPFEFIVPKRPVIKTFPAPQTYTFTFTQKPRIRTDRLTPTTTEIVIFPYQRRTVYEEQITPTTIYFDEQTPRKTKHKFTLPTVKPSFVVYTPAGRYWTRHIEPTTTSSYTFTIPTRVTQYLQKVPTSSSFTFTPRTRSWTKHRPQTTTRSYTFTLPTRRSTHRMDYSTSFFEYEPETKMYSYARPRTTTQRHFHEATPRTILFDVPAPKIKIVVVTPKPRDYTIVRTPTTAPTRRYPVTKVYEIICFVGATAGFNVVEFPREVVTKEVRFTTRAYHYQPKPKIKIKFIRPTTMAYQRLTVQVKEDRKKAPAPTPRIFYFTVFPHDYTQRKQATQVIPWHVPQRDWQFNVTMEPEKTIEYAVPYQPKFVIEIRTEKPGRFEVFTVPTVTYKDQAGKTAMKIIVCEILPRTNYGTRTTPLSRSFGFTPRGREYTQRIPQSAMRVYIYEVKPRKTASMAKPYVPKLGTIRPKKKYYDDHYGRYPPKKESYGVRPWNINYEREQATTRFHEFRPHRPIVYDFTFKPFEPERYDLPKSPKVYEFVVPVPQPNEYDYIPKVHDYEESRPGTTKQLRRYTFPGYEEYDQKTGKTLLFEIREPEAEFPEDEYEAPKPISIVLHPKPKDRYIKKRRTTIRPYHMGQAPRKEHKERPRGRTEIFEFQPEPHYVTEYVTPTKVDEFHYPPDDNWRVTFPEAKTRTFGFQPETKKYTYHIPGTTTEVFTFTVTRRPWTQSMKMPTTKRRVWINKPRTRSFEFTVPTRRTEYTVPSRSYTCEYPTIKPPTTCRTVIRKKMCDPARVKAWQDKIKKCVTQELAMEGKRITDYFDRPVDELEDYSLTCIKKLGDIPCKNSNLRMIEWVLEKVVSISGKYGENAENDGRKDDFGYHKMKECVTLADEGKLESCFPGLYDALTRVILYGSATVELVIPKQGSSKCVAGALTHCSPHTRQQLERIMHETLGTCVKFTSTFEKGACNENIGSHMRGSRKCSETEIFEFQNDLQYCLNQMMQRFELGQGSADVESMAESAAVCIKYNSPPECLKNDGNQASNVVQYITKFLSKQSNRGQQDCNRALSSHNLKACLQSYADLLPRLEEVGNKAGLVQPVVNCIRSQLASCPGKVADQVLASLFKLSIPRRVQVPMSRDSDLYSSINGIYVKDDKLDICEHVFRTNEEPRPTRKSIPDDCVVLKDNGDNEDKNYVLIKTCSEKRVNAWLKKLSDCTDEKTTKVGLNNPDYLTIRRTATLMEECIDQAVSPLKCRPKHQDDFTNIVKTMFQLLKHNSLSDEGAQCKAQLTAKRVSRCQKPMHTFVAFLPDASRIEPAQEKVLDCWRNTLKMCRDTVLEHIMDIFYIGMIQDESTVNMFYDDNDAEDCTPREGKSKRPKSNFLSFMHCGPGGVLHRRKREEDIPSTASSSGIAGRSKYSKLPNMQVPTEKKMYEVCVRENFISYFGKLKECGQTRLRLKFRRPKQKCRANDLIEYWTAMIECMIEEVGSELTCSIVTEDQMVEFLEEVSAVLDVPEQSSNSTCEVEPRCYGSDLPDLHRCSKEFLHLLEARETAVPLFNILKETGKVLDCLNEILPDCSTEVPFLSLSFLFMPLGLNYDLSITKGLKFADCSAQGSHKNISYPACIGRGHDNEIAHDNYDSIEACEKCIRKKPGICQLNNVTDVLEIAEEDLKRMSLCLKDSGIREDCLLEGTTRIKNNCFEHLYRFFKSVRKGIVITSIEYFWKFNECTLKFKSDCSENYQRFISEVYYRMLGWHPVFKTLLSLFYSPGFAY